MVNLSRRPKIYEYLSEITVFIQCCCHEQHCAFFPSKDFFVGAWLYKSGAIKTIITVFARFTVTT